tara:strand:+ start:2129 stop:2902 length:774 start_codon:yes stop_codon:yes gene_type:complete
MTNNSNNKPLVSIITSVLNGDKNLEGTIKSIVNQTYTNIEYIIIDGGSSDKTIDIIKKYENKISYWVSEKDAGIGDAFNKGIRVAKGDYINFQGDGDGFIYNNALEDIFRGINTSEDIFLSTRIQRVDEDGNEIFTSKHIKCFDKKTLLFCMSLPHQGLFTHKSYFSKYGLFNNNYIYCMDYDHLLRGYKSFPKVVTRDIIAARWREDGLGNNKSLEIYKEYDKSKRENKVADNVTLTLIKYWILLKHYMKALIGRV